MKTDSSSERPIAVDLFSGCGGLSLGLQRAGFRVLGAVDNDCPAVETYKANHPGVIVFNEDIRELTASSLMESLNIEREELDLLAGCPPCQGFSTTRTLNGSRQVDDPRNDLVQEFFRFVEGLLPKAILLENVPGLATNIRFRRFFMKVGELGYKGEFDILNAADYGVPQRRKRLIFVAGRNYKFNLVREKEKRITVRETISCLPPAGGSGDPLHDIPEKRTPKIAELISMIPKDGGSRTDLPESKQLECHKSCNGFKDIYGRMKWDDVAPTLTSGCFNPSKGRFLHPEENRAITMREAALLQGFPKKYIFKGSKSKSAIALMIGNSLPPNFVRPHAESILRFLISSQ